MRRKLRASSIRSIMVLDGESNTADPISKWVELTGANVVLARCPDEAIELLHDVVFIGCSLDGLLAEYRIGDRTACRIFYEFRHEYPTAPAAFLVDKEDISINCWAKARGVQLLQKPVCSLDVSNWVNQLAVPPACSSKN